MTKKFRFMTGLLAVVLAFVMLSSVAISQRNPTMNVLAWTAPSAIRSTSAKTCSKALSLLAPPQLP